PEHPCGDEHPQASYPRSLRCAGPARLLSIGLISRIPPLPAGHDCQPARQARSMRGFSREPERNNLAVLSTGSAAERPAAAEIGGRLHQFEMRPMVRLVWDPAAERPAAAEIGGRPHQFGDETNAQVKAATLRQATSPSAPTSICPRRPLR